MREVIAVRPRHKRLTKLGVTLSSAGHMYIVLVGIHCRFRAGEEPPVIALIVFKDASRGTSGTFSVRCGEQRDGKSEGSHYVSGVKQYILTILRTETATCGLVP